MELTNQASEFEPRRVAPQPVREGPWAALHERQAMATTAPTHRTRSGRAEGGWGDLSGLLRGARRTVFAEGSQDDPRVQRDPSDGGQEACDGQALCGDHRARTYRGGLVESLLEHAGDHLSQDMDQAIRGSSR